jgi:putative flippase GtrA
MRTKIYAKSCESSNFSDSENFAKISPSVQLDGEKGVRRRVDGKKAKIADSSPHTGPRKRNSVNEIQRYRRQNAIESSSNHTVFSALSSYAAAEIEQKAAKKKTLMRIFKFNMVGGIGIFVQFAALYFLKSKMQMNYLAATAIAVEAAVVHNFVWHERFTWRDRTDSAPRSSLKRLLHFNLITGAVSILGNVALMEMMVDVLHAHYLLANAIAVLVCSLANFMVSEKWVFRGSKRGPGFHSSFACSAGVVSRWRARGA